MFRRVFVFLLFLLIGSILLVPKQEDYFMRLSSDFGQIHTGQNLDEQMLKEMGSYEYTNFLIFSRFQYEFGSISVSYYGFLTFIRFHKSASVEKIQSEVSV